MMSLKREVHFGYSSIGCKNGMFLPKGCVNTRNTADAIVAGVMCLVRPKIACSINLVVAVPPPMDRDA